MGTMRPQMRLYISLFYRKNRRFNSPYALMKNIRAFRRFGTYLEPRYKMAFRDEGVGPWRQST